MHTKRNLAAQYNLKFYSNKLILFRSKVTWTGLKLSVQISCTQPYNTIIMTIRVKSADIININYIIFNLVFKQIMHFV